MAVMGLTYFVANTLSVAVEPITAGHINDTYVLTTASGGKLTWFCMFTPLTRVRTCTILYM